VLVYLPRDNLAPAEFFVLTSSDLHTLVKPVQDAWLKKCQEQHGGSYAGCVWGAPWRSRYYVYAIDYDRGGEWMGQAVMCTRDKEYTIRGIGDCLARGYDRTGFFEVDTAGQRAWTVQLTESSKQSVQKPVSPGGPVSGVPSGGSGALPLPGGTPAIALPPGRAGSAPSLSPSGARTQ
jgi:Protein of unknown function (DUF1036)